jgi:hypothetical protein
MKKISILAAGLFFSSMASAIQLPASGSVPVTTCNNLNEDVRINLTAGVVAGVSCTAARVALSACHTAGMLKSRSVGRKTINVDVTNPTTGVVTPTPTVVSCTVGTADADCASVAIQGAAVPSALSTRGTVNTEYPGTGSCTVGVAETVANGLN